MKEPRTWINPKMMPTLLRSMKKSFAQRKGIITAVYHQGKVFSQFCKKEKFVRLVAKFKIHNGIITFKINVFKLIQKYPGLKKSSVTLGFVKNYFKNIKGICKENPSEF